MHFLGIVLELPQILLKATTKYESENTSSKCTI